MNLKLILFFSAAVYAHAQTNLELHHVFGCFDSGDTVLNVMLDADVLYYADYKNETVVWDNKIPLFGQVPWAYKYAVIYKAVCLQLLHEWKEGGPVTKVISAPQSVIYPKEELQHGVENILICFISNFFPPAIDVKWTKNEMEVTAEESFIEPFANPDGTFHIISTLRFIPQQGDIYACTVKYEDLVEPKTTFWEPKMGEARIGPSVFCGVGLFWGLLGIAIGTFLFVKGHQQMNLLQGRKRENEMSFLE